MVGERARIFQWHDFALVCPGPQRLLARGVGDMLGNAAGSIEQVVEAAAFHQPRPFGVAVLVFHGRVALFHVGCAEALCSEADTSHFPLFVDSVLLADSSLQAHHVFIEQSVIEMWVAPVEVSLPVVVNPDGRVDVVPFAVVEERLADGVPERTCRRVGHGYADGHASGQLGVGADVPVILAVALDGLCGPGPAVGPSESGQVER